LPALDDRRLRRVAPAFLLWSVLGVLPAPAFAQVPRIAPPPPCRVSGVNDALLRLSLPPTRSPSLAVLAFTQGVVERRYSHVPWILSERIRERLRVHPLLNVAASGLTTRATFEAGGNADSARKLLRARWSLTGAVVPNRLDTEIHLALTADGAAEPAWQQRFMLSERSLAQIEGIVADTVSRLLTRRGAPSSMSASLSKSESDHALTTAQFLLTDHTLSAVEAARGQLEALFAADTSLPVALALARTTVLMLERGGLAPPQAPEPSLRRIDALIEYVLAKDPKSAEAWTIRAMAARYRDPVQLKGAVAAHRRAVSLDPRSAEASHQYGVTLMQLGETSGARSQLRRAVGLDPGRASSLAALAEVERRAGHSALTCALANASIAADPFDPRVYGSRALARLEVGQAREAYADAETAMQLTDAVWANGVRLMVEVAGANTSQAQSLGREYAQRFVAGRAVLTVEEALSLARAFVALGFEREAEGALLKARPAGRALRVGMADTEFARLRQRSAIATLFRSIPPPR